MHIPVTRTNNTANRGSAIRKYLSLVSVFVLLLGILTPAVYADDPCADESSKTSTSGALSDCQRKMYQAGNYAFDVVVGTGSGACADGSSTVTGSGNAEKIWNFFAGKGLTSVAIAGIMGNFHEESTEALDPAIKQASSRKEIPDGGDGKTGFGLAQWTSQGRQAALFAKMREAGLGEYYGAGWGHPEVDKDIPAEDLDALLAVELNFAWEGDTTKIKDISEQLNAATGTGGDSGSAVLFHRLYEASADNASQIKERVTAADNYLDQFGGSGVQGGSCAAAGVLGGVSSMDDVLPWAMRFISDTKAEYPGSALAIATLLKDPKSVPSGGGKIMSISTMPESENFICWGAFGCDECTTLSGWFVTKMTDYTYQGGSGGDVVGNLGAKGVPTGKEPRPFSVFSYAGHTGVVMGTLGDGTVITLENNWITNTLTVRQYDIKADHSDVMFAYVNDKLKISGLNQTNP